MNEITEKIKSGLEVDNKEVLKQAENGKFGFQDYEILIKYYINMLEKQQKINQKLLFPDKYKEIDKKEIENYKG